jgi:hypothetical protein
MAPDVDSMLVYLAVPYSHPDPRVQEQRFLAVNKVAAKLMLEGVCVFSPISHTHPIAQAGEMPKGWEFWARYDFEILSKCRKLIVLKLGGWDKSVGVTAEIKLATELGLEIEYLEPHPLFY